MTRIFADYAYGPGPGNGCWWDETVALPSFPTFEGSLKVDVAVVGGGFTGLSAAYHLAKAGAPVAVVDEHCIGWGASGRNGGFCCLGGGMRSDASLDRQYGVSARRAWRRTERTAIERVETLIDGLGLDVDKHSKGETCLAHSPRAAVTLEEDAKTVAENYGVDATVLSKADLAHQGFAGPFHGGMTVPLGFGLNPRKLLAGLINACEAFGVRLFEHSAAVAVESGGVITQRGRIDAERVLMATNGYSSDTVPNQIASTYMPAQSTVIVTRPMSEPELQRQGWVSDQMSFDTRRLLHYFRLMPDRRFLFGMRGGLLSGPHPERRARNAVLRDFHRMFPAWSDIDVTHAWSGLVCLSRDRLPLVGPVGDAPEIGVALAYHGNGVAMGVHCGGLLADWALGQSLDHIPEVIRTRNTQFPLGRFRRLLMPPVYAAYKVGDALR